VIPRNETLALIVLALAFAAVAPAAGDDYAAQIEAARAQRVERLTRPDGWLTLVGLHFLPPGESTVGRAPDNRIVLTAGPAHLGTITLSPESKVLFAPAPNNEAQIDGKPARAGELRPADGDAPPTVVTAGTVNLVTIERSGKMALRIKDSAADRRLHFLGLDYFPVDPGWRIEAQWVPFDPPREVSITNVIGNVSRERVPGKAVFQRDGRTYELWPLAEGPGDPLFFVFSDATSGNESHPMRFLDAAPPKNGTVVLDFNLATNPPCAFTPFATCPLPPPPNRLPLAVPAGERKYRGSQE
jgi:uncharacterized protein